VDLKRNQSNTLHDGAHSR